MAPERDPVAPESLLRHGALVRGLARAILPDEATADDVTQETWLAALQHPPRPGSACSPGSPGAWLARVTRRLAWRQLRGEERRRQRERAVARGEQTGEGGESAARELLLENVTRAVLELPGPYRTVVMLRYYEGLGPREIARRLELPLATVASRLQRGIDRIRTRLDERTDGGRRAWSVAAWSLALTQETLTMSSKWKVAAGAAALGIGLFGGRMALEGLRPDAPSEAAKMPAVLQAPSEPPALETVAAQAPGSAERIAVLADSGPVPEPPLAEATTGSLDLRVVWDESGAPVPGHGFQFFPWDSLEPFAGRFERATDEDGSIRIDGLVPGALMLYGFLSGGGRVEIVAGETTTEELRLPNGMRVEVRVVDASGAGVVGARIWLSEEMNDNDGRIVAESGVGGHASIAGVGPARHIAAFSADHGHAAMQRLEGNPGESIEVVLTVGREGRRLEGTLLDVDGLPVPGTRGARVRVESPMRRWRDAIPPLESSCDENGRFEFAGLPPGPVELSARAPGLAPVSLEIELDSSTEHARLVLHPAGRVRGTVTDAEGRPIQGAQIVHGQYGAFTSSFSRTRSDGSFRLANLPAGTVKLSAEHPRHGRAEALLELPQGEALDWSPALVPDAVLEGRVVDERGEPRAGFTIDAGGSRADPETHVIWSEQVRTDPEGRFRFASCPDEELSIEVRTAQYHLVDLIDGIRAADGPLTIEVEDAQLPSAGLRGAILDATGAPVAATVIVQGKHGYRDTHQVRSELESGTFEFGSLRPEEYVLRLRPDDLPEVVYGDVELAPDQIAELGTWWLTPPARVVLEVEGHGDAGPYERLTLFRQHPAHRYPALLYERADLGDMLVWPGTYVLRAEGPGVAILTREIEVPEQATTTVRLMPEAGVPCTFTLGPELADTRELLHFSLRNEREHLVATWNESRTERAGLRYEQRLVPGEYTLLVRHWSGEDPRTVTFRVEPGDEERRVDLP